MWCSPTFEAENLNKYQLGSGTPPTSNPASIYRDLQRAVAKSDEHNAKILSQKNSLMARAVEWCAAGHITEAKRDDLLTVVSMAQFPQWRPLLYVIPYSLVAGRVQEVPRTSKPSMEPEYIVPDLKRHEFEIVELGQ